MIHVLSLQKPRSHTDDNWLSLSAAAVLGTVAAACASSSQPEALVVPCIAPGACLLAVDFQTPSAGDHDQCCHALSHSRCICASDRWSHVHSTGVLHIVPSLAFAGTTCICLRDHVGSTAACSAGRVCRQQLSVYNQIVCQIGPVRLAAVSYSSEICVPSFSTISNMWLDGIIDGIDHFCLSAGPWPGL
jgi:hypothetical protein